MKDNVDVVCDIHDIPPSVGPVDAIVCNAVLQYCQDPVKVADQLHRVLKPGGYLFVDAPWVQPYCADTEDRFRYSDDGLRSIFSSFTIIDIGPSIRPGSAFAMQGAHIAATLTNNKYVNFVLLKVATLLLFPLRWIRTADERRTAGGFYLVAQKAA